MVIETNDAGFEKEVLKSELPVLVDFWATWCAPCKQLAPVLEKIGEKFAGKLKIVKVNIEDSPETPTKYEVRGIPNLILFKDGEVVDTKVGNQPETALANWIEENL